MQQSADLILFAGQLNKQLGGYPPVHSNRTGPTQPSRSRVSRLFSGTGEEATVTIRAHEGSDGDQHKSVLPQFPQSL